MDLQEIPCDLTRNQKPWKKGAAYVMVSGQGCEVSEGIAFFRQNKQSKEILLWEPDILSLQKLTKNIVVAGFRFHL